MDINLLFREKTSEQEKQYLFMQGIHLSKIWVLTQESLNTLFKHPEKFEFKTFENCLESIVTQGTPLFQVFFKYYFCTQ